MVSLVYSALLLISLQVLVPIATQNTCHDYTIYSERLSNLELIIDGEIFTQYYTDNVLYNRLSQQWNAKFNDLQPNAIIYVESADDISSVLTELIIPCSVPFSVRSAHLGGHLWSGYSVTDYGVIIDLSRLNNIRYSKYERYDDDRYIVLEPGVTQFWANQFTKPFLSIFPTSGDCNQFSFGGFLQGGGLSLFLRSAGIAADYIEKAEIVLMSGDIVLATKNNEYSDLLYGIKGGGAGNFGIITKYFMSTFEAPINVISFEVYWLLSSFTNKDEIATFLRTWSQLQKGNNYQEFTSWLVVTKDEKYMFRMLGIWNGDINDGFEFWENEFLAHCDCKDYIIPNKGNVFATNPWNAVEIHQSTFGGQAQFDGVIDARTVSDKWSDRIINDLVDIMVSHQNDNQLNYIWLLVAYGGRMLDNDPNSKHTSFGHRDAVGDITLLISSVNGNEKNEINRLNEIRTNFFDQISPFYYPNHPSSTRPVNNIPVAFYDCANKPIYTKLVNIKKKYDPGNLLNNPVTIDV
eukprot:109719_1